MLHRKLKVKDAYESTPKRDCEINIIESLMPSPLKQCAENQAKADKFNILEVLLNWPIFSGVDRNELENLALVAHILRFTKGETIILEGSIPTSFYITKDGMVKVFKTSLSGKEFIIDTRYRGEIFGAGPLLRGSTHYASVKALEDTEIIAIRKSVFLDFLARNQSIASRITDLELQRFFNLYERLMDLVACNSSQRVIKVLYGLVCKYGNTLRFTHQEIAEMSGTTAETVSRVLTPLKGCGILRSTRGSVIITDKQKLRFEM